MLEQLEVTVIHDDYLILYRYIGDANTKWRSIWVHGKDEAKEFIATINEIGK